MSYTSCRPVTQYLTTLLAQPQVGATLSQMRESGAADSAFIEFFAKEAPPDVGVALREQFGSLPSLTMTTLLAASELAQETGRTLAVETDDPTSVTEYARKKKMTITLDVEDGLVRVGIRHVGRHNPA